MVDLVVAGVEVVGAVEVAIEAVGEVTGAEVVLTREAVGVVVGEVGVVRHDEV